MLAVLLAPPLSYVLSFAMLYALYKMGQKQAISYFWKRPLGCLNYNGYKQSYILSTGIIML